MKNILSSPAESRVAAEGEGDPGRNAGKLAAVLVYALAGFVAFAPAGAAQQQACMKAQDFEKQGSKLVRTKAPDYAHLYQAIPDFFCDRVACFGTVAFEGIVGEDGTLRNLRLAENTWKDRPAEHAAVIKERILSSHYAPLRLKNGTPVCIRMRWEIVLKSDEPKKKP